MLKFLAIFSLIMLINVMLIKKKGVHKNEKGQHLINLTDELMVFITKKSF